MNRRELFTLAFWAALLPKTSLAAPSRSRLQQRDDWLEGINANAAKVAWQQPPAGTSGTIL